MLALVRVRVSLPALGDASWSRYRLQPRPSPAGPGPGARRPGARSRRTTGRSRSTACSPPWRARQNLLPLSSRTSGHPAQNPTLTPHGDETAGTCSRGLASSAPTRVLSSWRWGPESTCRALQASVRWAGRSRPRPTRRLAIRDLSAEACPLRAAALQASRKLAPRVVVRESRESRGTGASCAKNEETDICIGVAQGLVALLGTALLCLRRCQYGEVST